MVCRVVLCSSRILMFRKIGKTTNNCSVRRSQPHDNSCQVTALTYGSDITEHWLGGAPIDLPNALSANRDLLVFDDTGLMQSLKSSRLKQMASAKLRPSREQSVASLHTSISIFICNYSSLY